MLWGTATLPTKGNKSLSWKYLPSFSSGAGVGGGRAGEVGRGLLLKEIICSLWVPILPLNSRLHFKRVQILGRKLPVCISCFLLQNCGKIHSPYHAVWPAALQIFHIQSANCIYCVCQQQRPSPGPEVIKHFSCSTQLSKKFILLINLKILTIF